MKVKCYSVRLKKLIIISDKSCKAATFDGSIDIIPISQIFGQDDDVQKSNAYWISAWILEKKNLQYSDRKVAWFNTETNQFEPNYIIEHHIPERKEPINSKPDATLIR